MMLWPFFDTGPPLCTATTLATLARETAEDVFDGLTTDCTEPHRLPPRERNTMPKYTIELVPTMPLPHAPAPADVAAAFAEVERTMDAHYAALVALDTTTAAWITAEKRYALVVDAATRAAEVTP